MPQAQMLLDTPQLRAIFDAVLGHTKDARKASGIVFTQLLGAAEKHQKGLHELPTPSAILDLLDLVASGAISGNTAKGVLEEMVQAGKTAEDIIAAHDLSQIADEGELQRIVARAIAANPNAIAAFRNGKTQALGAVVGWVMKETKGKADPAKVNVILKEKIGELM